MTAHLLAHKKTKQQLDNSLKKPPQALLIYGPTGSGKRYLAENLAAELLNIELTKLMDYPYFSVLQRPENKQEIPIEAVREIIRKLNLKAVIGSSKDVRRVILIDGAHLMSAEAQNALLKIIEEPPPATVFILTAVSDKSVLPTVASRAEKLAVSPVTLDDSKRFYEKRFKPESVSSAWSLSGGAPGLLDALLLDSSQHELKIAVDSAKAFLRLNKYQRILFLDSLSTNKEQLTLWLDALARILTSLHRSSIYSDNPKQAKLLAAARRMVNSTADSLRKNTSAKLLSLNLALRLPI